MAGRPKKPPAPQTTPNDTIDPRELAEDMGGIPELQMSSTVSHTHAPAPTIPMPIRPDRSRRSPREVAEQRMLDSRLPTAYTVDIYHVGDGGELGLCDVYNASTIMEHPSVEHFIRKFLVPKWGYGKYRVFQVAPNGERTDRGSVYIPAPITTNEERTSANVLDKLVDFQMRQTETAQSRNNMEMNDLMKEILKQRIVPAQSDNLRPVDPMDKLTQMIMLKAMAGMFDPPKPVGPDSAIAELVRTMDRINNRMERLETSRSMMDFPPMMPPTVQEPQGLTPRDLLAFAKEFRDHGPAGTDPMVMLEKAMFLTQQAFAPKMDALANTLNTLESRLERLAERPDVQSRPELSAVMSQVRELRQLQEELAPPAPVVIHGSNREGNGENTLGAISSIINSIPNVITSIRQAAESTPPQVQVQPGRELDIGQAIEAIPSMSDVDVVDTIGKIVHALRNHPSYGPAVNSAIVSADPATTQTNLIALLEVPLAHFENTGKLTAEQKSRILRLVKSSGVRYEG